MIRTSVIPMSTVGLGRVSAGLENGTGRAHTPVDPCTRRPVGPSVLDETAEGVASP